MRFSGRSAPRGATQTGWRRLVSEERAAILALVTLMGLVILGMVGVVVDLGIAYVNKAEISRAMDAGSLAGARNLRNGEDVARDQALALAAANGVSSGDGTTIDVSFGTNPEGESTVSMSASRPMNTIFLKALGKSELTVGSAAIAAVPPVDLVLVLDQSGSLDRNHAFDDLQRAAKQFVDHFDDDIDQLGLVSFQLRAADRFLIDGNFTWDIKRDIDSMVSAGDTNIGEGLRYALEQMHLSNVRDRSSKVVVFFTDGRPTAFRGVLGSGGPANGGSALGPFTSWSWSVRDRLMAVYTTTTNRVRGYFNDPDNLPVNGAISADGCRDVSSCWGWNEWDVRDKAHDAGLEVANQIRSERIYIYSIGLGDPYTTPMEQPDMDYLRAIANEGGMTDSHQPTGKAYFAPSAAELEAVFNQVAQDLLVRLAQ